MCVLYVCSSCDKPVVIFIHMDRFGDGDIRCSLLFNIMELDGPSLVVLKADNQ